MFAGMEDATCENYDKFNEKQSRQMVDYEDLIYKEEEYNVRANPVFNGIESRQDQILMYEIQRVTELKKALKTDDVQKNNELREALEKEIYGYSKREMTRWDLEKEKQMLDGAHNLDFMMEDGELM